MCVAALGMQLAVRADGEGTDESTGMGALKLGGSFIFGLGVAACETGVAALLVRMFPPRLSTGAFSAKVLVESVFISVASSIGLRTPPTAQAIGLAVFVLAAGAGMALRFDGSYTEQKSPAAAKAAKTKLIDKLACGVSADETNGFAGTCAASASEEQKYDSKEAVALV